MICAVAASECTGVEAPKRTKGDMRSAWFSDAYTRTASSWVWSQTNGELQLKIAVMTTSRSIRSEPKTSRAISMQSLA